MGQGIRLNRHGGGHVEIDPYVGCGETSSTNLILHVVSPPGASSTFRVDLDEAFCVKLEAEIARWRQLRSGK